MNFRLCVIICVNTNSLYPKRPQGELLGRGILVLTGLPASGCFGQFPQNLLFYFCVQSNDHCARPMEAVLFCQLMPLVS